jgi:uncharacterized Zn-binding protein involved in type VI secretion
MGMPAARITDMHTCPMVTVLVPHIGGPIVTRMWTVLTGMLPQAPSRTSQSALALPT